MQSKRTGLRTNEAIRVKKIRLVGLEEEYGIIETYKALEIQIKRLDLVEIVPNDSPPVCKAMDYVDTCSSNEKTKKEIRKNKMEIKFRPVTDIGDYNIKLKRINEFLESGHKVKVV